MQVVFEGALVVVDSRLRKGWVHLLALAQVLAWASVWLLAKVPAWMLVPMVVQRWASAQLLA